MIDVIASCFKYILGGKGAASDGAVVPAQRRPYAVRGNDVILSSLSGDRITNHALPWQP